MFTILEQKCSNRNKNISKCKYLLSNSYYFEDRGLILPFKTIFFVTFGVKSNPRPDHSFVWTFGNKWDPCLRNRSGSCRTDILFTIYHLPIPPKDVQMMLQGFEGFMLSCFIIPKSTFMFWSDATLVSVIIFLSWLRFKYCLASLNLAFRTYIVP